MCNIQKYIIYAFLLIAFTTCHKSNFIDPEPEIRYCLNKAKETLDEGITENLMPRTIKSGEKDWTMARVSSWTSGYWTGILWLLHQYTEDSFWREHAVKNTELLIPDKSTFFNRQDFGLSVMLSIGHAYEHTQSPVYKDILINSAKLYYDYSSTRPEVFGLNKDLLLSDHYQQQYNHGLLNLCLLFKASENVMPAMYDFSKQKAFEISEILEKRIQWTKNTSQPGTELHFFSDVSVFNNRGNNQNRPYGDDVLTRKNIAWLMYGFISVYQESKEKQLLENADYLAFLYIQNYLKIKNKKSEPGNNSIQSIEDLGTSAIAASALLKIALAQPSKKSAPDLFLAANSILKELASEKYRSRNKNKAFLIFDDIESPTSSDVSLIYTDYYYLEALLHIYVYIKKDRKN
jgi:unsaturated chondroitin disaccharide hydrolase